MKAKNEINSPNNAYVSTIAANVIAFPKSSAFLATTPTPAAAALPWNSPDTYPVIPIANPDANNWNPCAVVKVTAPPNNPAFDNIKNAIIKP